MNTLTCPKCDYTLLGDEPSIEVVCEVCKTEKLTKLYFALADVFDDEGANIDNFNYKLVEDLMAHINSIQTGDNEEEIYGNEKI